MAVLAIANPIWGIITACPSLNVIDGTKAYGIEGSSAPAQITPICEPGLLQ